ncbi:hypothetical protein SDC9_205851 [bioreactor metagenome]|uniref:Uncharacterized protein n=1 Tax=bioreactor metagenome TaxID=1076179 RepID=A0A645J4T2_9ZZZZ
MAPRFEKTVIRLRRHIQRIDAVLDDIQRARGAELHVEDFKNVAGKVIVVDI